MAPVRRRMGLVWLTLGLSLLALAGARAGGAPHRRGVAVGRRAAASARAHTAAAPAVDPKILLGRHLVLSHLCSACHGGRDDPDAPGWLAGGDSFRIGLGQGGCRPRAAGAATPTAPRAPCYVTRARNLTPDNETGLGRFSERQIFNALRYGLRPEDTPDVTITATTPGNGNFPLHPHYLAPPMPWWAFRHMEDAQLWAIAAYLKRGLKPVRHRVPESDGPPDFWAGAYASGVDKVGPYPPPPFPTANEVGSQAATSPHR